MSCILFQFISFPLTEQSNKKRKHLSEITNKYDNNDNHDNKEVIISPVDILPQIVRHSVADNSGDILIPDSLHLQNVHFIKQCINMI